ncbi:MAG: ATP-binding cassette domain-containing protein [Caulobacteraceae bacterium]|nr:ATP-binding cassette domain-containing protein [Caulobacteraceae bacterium]
MSEVELADAAGRPGAGAVLAEQLAQTAQRRPGRRDLSPLRRLWPFVGAHKGDAVFAGFFLILATVATLGLSIAVRMIADSMANTMVLRTAMLEAAAIAALLAVSSPCRYYFVTRLGERVVADLRQAIYDHILTLDQAFFLKVRTGEVLSRMTTDLTLVETMLATSVSVALRNTLMFVGALAMLIIVTPRYTLMVLLLVPVLLFPMFYVGRQVRRRSVQAQDRFAQAIGYAGESLDALETVQGFGREASVARTFGEAVEAAFKASLLRIRIRAFMIGMVFALVLGGVGVIIFLAAKDTFIAHTIKPGVFFQFILLAIFAVSSMGQIGETIGDVQKAAGAMERIGELLDARPGIAAPPRPQAMPVPARGEIAFEGVTFAYPGRPDLAALRGFSLAVRSGERVALVGPSGAGKSTVLRLLLRFYDPQEGAVRIDGVDLKTCSPAEARARIALVGQDAPLFSGSAYENLRFGREEASPEAMRAAAEAAQAAGFLDALPQGFETPIGERAKTLSGGQRQRLAIARALVRDAPILLLDEATSALDAENERLVQQALEKAMAGRTTLVIAHRLATVLKADRIVVMDEGRVVEQGVHQDLVAQGGLYARLAQLQFGMEAG